MRQDHLAREHGLRREGGGIFSIMCVVCITRYVFLSPAEELIQSWLAGVEDSRTPLTSHDTGSCDSSVYLSAWDQPTSKSQHAVKKTHEHYTHSEGVPTPSCATISDRGG